MRVTCVIPTYNEVKNIKPLIEEIYAQIDTARIQLDILIVDDNSPDGTADEVRRMAAVYPVDVLVREGKMGLGSAVRAGFAHTESPYILVMDADMSHDPSVLNVMFEALLAHDIVIGSRFLSESYVQDWKPARKALSYIGVWMAKHLTRVEDPLSGYFAIRRDVISGVALTTVGYKILFEILIKGRYDSVTEIPFTFRIRTESVSKLNVSEYRQFFSQCVTYWWWKHKQRT